MNISKFSFSVFASLVFLFNQFALSQNTFVSNSINKEFGHTDLKIINFNKTKEEFLMELFFLEEENTSSKLLANKYFEYAIFLFNAGELDKSIEAFQHSETYGYESLGKLYFELAKVYVIKGNVPGNVEDLLIQANNLGYPVIEEILKNEIFITFLKTNNSTYLQRKLTSDINLTTDILN